MPVRGVGHHGPHGVGSVGLGHRGEGHGKRLGHRERDHGVHLGHGGDGGVQHVEDRGVREIEARS